MNLLSRGKAVSSVLAPASDTQPPSNEHDRFDDHPVAIAECSGPVNPVADGIGGWTARLVEWGRSWFRARRGLPPPPDPAQASILAGKAAATAAGALEGILIGKSLEGALKEAEVVNAYASARQKNAEAEKLEAEAAKLRAETEKLRQDMALDRVERVLALHDRVRHNVTGDIDPKES